jgi:hypothetical protein
MITPVQRIQPLRFLKRNEVIQAVQEEKKENPHSSKKRQQKRNMSASLFLSAYPTMNINDNTSDKEPDHDEVINQYLYQEGKSNFEAVV